MRVDFYQLSRDPVDVTVAKLARKAMQANQRLLIVSGEDQQRKAISKMLWEQGGTAFLAHGMADGEHVDRQPILISGQCDALNGASTTMIADGTWRDSASSFERVILIFDAAVRDDAAALWRRFAADDAVDNRIFKQTEQGGWREGR